MTRRKALTKEQIKEIREIYKKGKIGYSTIAKRYGVGASTIRDHIHFYRGYSA